VKERKIVFWDCEDSERLQHETVDDAVEAYLDARSEIISGTIIAKGFARRVVNVESAQNICDDILEGINEEYGDPDADYMCPTPKMLKAAEKLRDIIAREYVSWACEHVATEEIDIAAWIKENAPHWNEEAGE